MADTPKASPAANVAPPPIQYASATLVVPMTATIQTCLTCGAAVFSNPDDQTDAAELHRKWHAAAGK